MSTLRLSPRFRLAFGGVFGALFVTGAAWLVADRLKDGPAGEIWQQIAANLLMLHGGAAMMALLLLGALFSLHAEPAWRDRKNRTTGAIMVAVNTILIATAFGLYYAGLELLRPWLSWAHIIAGFLLPALLFVHIVTGKRSR
jgi:hypothetical protein